MTTDPQNRAEWPKPILITIGIIHLVASACCFLSAGSNVFSMVMIGQIDGVGGSYMVTMVLTTLVYLAIAGAAVAAGIGLIRRSEWGRKLARILQIPIFILGLVGIGGLLFGLATSPSRLDNSLPILAVGIISALATMAPSATFFVLLGRPEILAETRGEHRDATVEANYQMDHDEPPPPPSADA